MARYVAFLRGINVSAQKLIKMEDLRAYFVMPGISNVVTYIQSGNVVFDAKETDEVKLHKKITRQLEQKLGYSVPVVLRTIAEIGEVIKNNPFDKLVAEQLKRLYVTFLSEEPAPELRGVLDAYLTETDDARLVMRAVYLHCGNYGTTKLSNTFIEKKMKVTATTRNWATVNKMMEL